jgi:uncharacterized damage-inducible protein DinB
MFSRADLLAVHGWAHESIEILFTHAADFTQEQLLQEFPGFGQTSLWATLLHIVGVENYWLYMLSGKLAVEDYPSETTAMALDEHRRLVASALREYLNSRSEAELNTETTFHGDANEQPVTHSPAFVVQHLITHAFHHKGQAAAQCRLLGRPMPDSDMLRWLPA